MGNALDERIAAATMDPVPCVVATRRRTGLLPAEAAVALHPIARDRACAGGRRGDSKGAPREQCDDPDETSSADRSSVPCSGRCSKRPAKFCSIANGWSRTVSAVTLRELISGAITRRYHGLLIAALPAPLGRMVMWSHVSEFLRFSEDDVVSLGAEERAGGQLNLQGADFLREFRLEDGLPVWIYRVRDLTIEKRVLLPHLQNTVHISYQVIGDGQPPRLELRPAFHFRHHEAPVDEDLGAPYKLTAVDGRYEIASAQRTLPPFRMRLCGHDSEFTIAPSQYSPSRLSHGTTARLCA